MQWQQFDHLVSLIKSDNNNISKNKRLLTLCNMILDSFELKDGQLKETKKDDLIDLFVEFQNIGKSTVKFNENAFKYLNVRLQEGKYGAKINKLKDDIKDYNIKINSLVELNKELLEKENEYIKLNEQLVDLEGKINDLNEIKEKAQPEYISYLNDTVKKLESELGSDKYSLEELESKKEELEESINIVENRSSNTIEEIKQGIEKLYKVMNYDWSKLDEELFRKEDSYNKTFNAYKKTFEKLNNLLNAITEVEEIQTSNIQLYQVHFSNNNTLWSSLKEVNYKDNQKLKQQIEKILKDKLPKIDKELNEMDTTLRELIQVNQEARSKIRKFNRTE